MVNLLVGGSGFIGMHLARALAGRGEPVRIFDINRPPGHDRALWSIDFRPGSVADLAALRAAMEGASCVFHMAANAHLWAQDKTVFNRINFEGTQNVLKAATELSVPKLVYTSSYTTLISKKVGAKLMRLDETAVTTLDDMLGPYPRSKWLAERAVLEAARSGLDAVVVMPTMPVGPGDYGRTGPTKMILDYVNGATPAVLNTRMNMIDARDLAAAHIAARDRGRSGERYLLGGPNLWVTEIVDKIGAVSGRKMPAARVPYGLALAVAWADEVLSDHVTRRPPTAPLTGVRIAGRRLDFVSAKAQAELGLTARPLEDSLADQIAWYEEQGWLKPQ